MTDRRTSHGSIATFGHGASPDRPDPFAERPSLRVRGLLVALTDPARPEEDADFHHWYDTVQIPAFFAQLPGTLRAIRYRVFPIALEPALVTQQEYLALYDLGFPSAAGLADY